MDKPSREELERTWGEYAYSIFVQGSVGLGAKSRPTKEQWQDAALSFERLLEKLRPLKVIVTGKTMWNHHMPGCTGPHLCDVVQAYKLSDSTLVWCLAVPHPSNRKKGEGFQWEWVGKNIRAFRSINFPLREN
jgi:uracil-DNA glycosylase